MQSKDLSLVFLFCPTFTPFHIFEVFEQTKNPSTDTGSVRTEIPALSGSANEIVV